MPADPFGEQDLPVAVLASMPPPAGGRGDVTLVGLYLDGSRRTLAAWSELVGPADRVLVSRSPAGRRAAVAVGRTVRTFDLLDGRTMSSKPIGHSEPSVVFGWTEDGAVITRDTAARSGPDLPLADGWVLHADGEIDQDDGFSGGPTGTAAQDGQPAQIVELFAAAEAAEAAGIGADAGAGKAAGVGAGAGVAVAGRRLAPFSLTRAGVVVPLPPGPYTPPEATTLFWPPVAGPAGILVRNEVGGSDWTSVNPWLVRSDGTRITLPIGLTVSPLCALPDGRFLLPGASELWRDDAEEPIATIAPDGSMGELLIDGAPVSPVRILDDVAPDLLDAIPFEAPEHRQWRNDSGLWVQAGRISQDGERLTLLLAEAAWTSAAGYAPGGARWLVVSLPLDDPAGTPASDASSAIELIARGERAEGEHLTIAL